MNTTAPRPTDRLAPSPWREVFAALCRQAAERGISQADLARDLGVARKDVNRWTSDEKWSREPPAWVVRRVAARFGLAVVVRAEEVLLVDDAQLAATLGLGPRP